MEDKSLVTAITTESSILGSIAGELSTRSLRVYTSDAKVFAQWLIDRGIGPETIDRQIITEYRAHLVTNYAPATGKRMFSVARRLLDEQVIQGHIPVNPGKGVKGIKAEDDSPHIALTLDQASRLLAAIDTSNKKGKRDYAIIITLLYTGIRRFECAGLCLGDMSMERGHHILTIRGKGNRRENVKLRVEAWRAITEYLEVTKRDNLPNDAPMFCAFDRWDNTTKKPIGSMVVYRTVIEYAVKSGLKEHFTPHGMRATFVTLSIEGGSSLEKTQTAARHKEPKTTLRYLRRRNNLDDNAVDYIKLKEE